MKSIPNIIFITVILTCLNLNSAAQTCYTIKGIITDTAEVTLAGVIIQGKINDKTLFTTTNNEGILKIEHCEYSSPSATIFLSLKIKLLGYSETDTIIEIRSTETDIGIIRLKQKIIHLSEVILENKPVIKRGDTTIFTIAAFKNKADENLEDVLKKIPGFDVSNGGAILYNGRPVDDIMIEGESLTKNYRLISQNIAPDMISKMEVIDKYEKNSVLKGLAGGKGQIINLRLSNPRHVQTFGNIKAGAGTRNSREIAGNTFALNKKLKSFLLFNGNNQGNNPYNEVNFDDRFITDNQYEFPVSKMSGFITENLLFNKPLLGDYKNNLFNNSKLGVLNNSISISPKINLKIYSDVYVDKIHQYDSMTLENIQFPTLSYSSIFTRNFSPVTHTHNFNFRYLSGKTQLLIAGLFSAKNYKENNTISDKINYNSTLESQYYRPGIAAYFTRRVDSLTAFEVSVQYLKEKKEQQYQIIQNGLRTLSPSIISNQFGENTKIENTYFKSEARYIIKKKNGAIEQFNAKYSYSASPFASGLSFFDNNTNQFEYPSNYYNNNTFNTGRLLTTYSIKENIGKFDISGEAGLQLQTFSKIDNQLVKNKETDIYFVMPSFSISRNVGKKENINCIFSYDNETPSFVNQEESPLLISYRRISSMPPPIVFNIPSFKINFNYTRTDIEQATTTIFGYFHQSSFKGNILAVNFSKDFDFFENRFTSKFQNNDNIYFKYDKYFFKLKSAISIKQNLSWYNFPITLNDKVISNKNFIYNINLLARPKISQKWNTSFGTDYFFVKDISSAKKVWQLSPFADIGAEISKNINWSFSLKHHLSNYATPSQSYLFCNTAVWISLIKNKVDLKVSGNNLFNVKYIYAGTKSDILSQSLQSSILGRIVKMSISLKF